MDTKNLNEKENSGREYSKPRKTHPYMSVPLRPMKINHGDAFGCGSNWITFYCPNRECQKQISGETECPRCGQKVIYEQ